MTTNISPDGTIIEGQGSEQDSAVIKALREKEKELSRRVKELEGAEESALIKARAVVQREQSAFQIVNGLGFPKLAPLVVEKIEGDITEESVKAYLEGIGLSATAGESGGAGNTQASGAQVAGAVAGVASLGQQLASATRNPGGQPVLDRLSAATTAEEVATIAADAGFAVSI